MDLTESFPITRERTAGGYRLAPSGELDVATVPLLEAAFDEAGDAPVLLDLEGVTFIDSRACSCSCGSATAAPDASR